MAVTKPGESLAAGALTVAVALSAPGCAPKRSAPGPVLAATARDLAPEASPGEAASLRLGSQKGMEFEVALRQSRKGTAVALEIVSGGETLEREAYRADAAAFRVVRAGDDVFEPPIDLLRFPLRAGGAWGWEGKVVYAGTARDAHADVAVRKDGAEVLSGVALFVAVDAGRPEIKRSLEFWFRKGQGVARRSFGGVSSRFPRGETWPP